MSIKLTILKSGETLISDAKELLNEKDQVLLSIMDNPGVWFNAPLVYIKSRQKGDTIKKIIGIDKDVKKAPLVSFFDSLGNYKLATNLEKAYLATVPTQIEKDIIELDRRVNLLYSALEGKIMRIFPDYKKWLLRGGAVFVRGG